MEIVQWCLFFTYLLMIIELICNKLHVYLRFKMVFQKLIIALSNVLIEDPTLVNFSPNNKNTLCQLTWNCFRAQTCPICDVHWDLVQIAFVSWGVELVGFEMAASRFKLNPLRCWHNDRQLKWVETSSFFVRMFLL